MGLFFPFPRKTGKSEAVLSLAQQGRGQSPTHSFSSSLWMNQSQTTETEGKTGMEPWIASNWSTAEGTERRAQRRKVSF